MSGFVHLRLHSEYDLLKGVARLQGDSSVIAQASQLGQPALAITDGGNLFGAVKFFESCYRYGVKPIIGCEVRVDDKTDTAILCLCANQTGYGNLVRLISRSYREGGWVRPDWLTPETTNGLIALSGARAGLIGRQVARGQTADALADDIARWAARFPDSFYLEVWRAAAADDAIFSITLKLGEQLGLPLVATHPVQCANEDETQRLNFRLCVAHGQQINDERRARPLSDAPYLLSEAQMRERFPDYPGILENTVAIAQRCNYQFQFGQVHLPSISEGQAEAPAQLIRQYAQDGLARKLPAEAEARAQYQMRLDHELAMIEQMGFIDYFLIVMDFIRWAKQNDIPVGPGRGSGAGSLVAYALDITAIDPMQFGLLFERFLNPERVSLPDFDIDFCVNGRDQVIRYVEQKYGQARVSQIVTFGTMGAKGAIRDSGRILGLPYHYCDDLARMVPNDLGITLQRALDEVPDLADARNSERGDTLLAMALQVEGLPRNISTHAGGVLIAPSPLEDFCPRIFETGSEATVTQLDMIDVEKIGLVKFDFLGLRALTAIDQIVRFLKQTRQLPESFRIEDIALDDARVFELYQRGDVIGVFQCESSGMRDLMMRLSPDNFSDIIALIALYRPGPIQANMTDDYVKRKNKLEAVEYIDDSLRPILQETYGVYVYQEQIMNAAQAVANYSLGEADLLRRAMGKKKPEEMRALKDDFVARAKTQLGERNASDLFDAFDKFAGYGFNKSHSAAYALVSYQMAYLKTHFRTAFLAGIATTERHNSEQVRILIRAMKAGDIAVAPPNINSGRGEFVATSDTEVQYGLYAIKGIGEAIIDEIISARGDVPFADLFDFCTRLKDNKNLPYAIIEKLIYAGALDVLDAQANRAALLASLSLAMSERQMGDSLFAKDTGLVKTPPWNTAEQLQKEWKVLGDFTLSGSFIDLYADLIAQLPGVIRDFTQLKERQTVRVAGLFVRTRTSKQMRRQNLTVVVLDDGLNEMDVLANQQAVDALYKSNADKLTPGQTLLVVEGETRQRSNDPISIANKPQLWTIDQFLKRRLHKMIIRCGYAHRPTPQQLRANLLPHDPRDETNAGCELVVDYRDDHLSCRCSLGDGWEAGEGAYRRLRALLHKDNEIRLVF